MTRKQARALVKGVKDKEIIKAWKEKLGGVEGDMETEGEDEAILASVLKSKDEGW